MRRGLAPVLVGRRITRVVTGPPSYFFLTPPEQLAPRLEGRCVEALERHGKYLLAELSDGARLLLHLGMTGQLFVEAGPERGGRARRRLRAEPPPSARERHHHLTLGLRGGLTLVFRDVRKFGKVRWLAPGQSDPRLDKLGPDALDVSAALLQAAGRRRKCAIKSLLLDQSVLAGVGNIYADEALYLAAVRPMRSAQSLRGRELEALSQAVRSVLLRAIELGGSSISDYVHPDGGRGSYQLERHVYGRAGQPCQRCGGPVERAVVGQRSTHWCPRCQR